MKLLILFLSLSLFLFCSVGLSSSQEITGRTITDRHEYYDSLCELNVSLPKHFYKEFEPVIAHIVVINHDKDTLALWGPLLFTSTITDVHGIKYYNCSDHTPYAKISYVLPNKPQYIIYPDDTLFLTMFIIEWGDTYHLGSYKVNIEAKVKYNPLDVNPLKDRYFVNSNEDYFEIIQPDDTVKEILSLYKKADFRYLKPYEEIIKRFPGNPLTEHVYSTYLGVKYSNNFRLQYINDLENDFKEFIYRYPKSEYLLNDSFVDRYLNKHFKDLKTNTLIDNFDNEYENFKSQNENNFLKYFLKDKRRTLIILNPELLWNHNN